MKKTARNFEVFDKKRGFYNHFWPKIDVILEDVSVAEITIFKMKK